MDSRNGRGWWRCAVLGSGRRIALAAAATWMVALVLLVPLAAELDSVQSDSVADFLPADADSTAVAAIADAIEQRAPGQAFVVYHRTGGLTTADHATIVQHRDLLAGNALRTGQPVPAEDGSTAFFLVRQPPVPAGVDAEDAAASFIIDLRDAVAVMPEGLAVWVTGPTAIEVDIDDVFDGINSTLLLVTVSVVGLLLIVTYRSPLLWLVPLVSVGVAAVAATAAVYAAAAAAGWQVSTPSTTIMIVLVFGAGTDYALLLVSGYREQLRRVPKPGRAMWAALRRTGPVIAASAATSSVGLLCLMAAQMNNIRGLGLVGAIGIVATAVTMLTLLPALLVLAGRGAFWPFVPRAGSHPAGGRGWRRIAATVTRAPGRVAASSSLVLAGLALAALTLPNELADLDSFTTPAESVHGYQQLASAYPDLAGRPVVVAAPRPQEAAALRVIDRVPGFSHPTVEGRDSSWVLIEVDVAAAPDSDDERVAVATLREQLDQPMTGDVLVGGSGAERLDAAAAVRRDLLVTIPLVLAVVLLVLTLLLRAIVAPLVITGAVVLAFGAALGIGALAFEHLFGFAGAEPDLPLLCFVFLVALGVDYAIFLVARLRHHPPQTGVRDAARAALAATGPVIVSAGVVLAATFAALMTLPYVPMVQIGFVVAIGVLLESLIIPALVLTPLAVRLRTRLWWPRRPDRRTPAGAVVPAVALPARE